MALSFFRSRGARAEEAPLPLVTALPAGRREAAVLPEITRTGDDRATGSAEAPHPGEFEDDVMRNVFAQLNRVDAVLPGAAAIAQPADPALDRMADAEPAAVAGKTESMPAAAPDDASAAEAPAATALCVPALALPPGAPAPSGAVPDATAADPDPAPPLPHRAGPVPEAGPSLPDESIVAGMLAAEAAAGPAQPPLPGRRAPRRLRQHLPGPHWPALRRRATADARSRPLSPQDRLQRWLAALSLLPVPVILAGAFLGAFGSLAALVLVAALCVVQGDLRHLQSWPDLPPLPAGRLAGLVATLVLILAFAVFALTGGIALGAVGWVATILSTAVWLAETPARAARDLAAARPAALRRVGRLIFALLLLPHRPAAERLLHRRLGATSDDPLTADAGESVYAFAAHALPGAIVAGYEMERVLMRARLGSRRAAMHPHLILGLASLGWLGVLVALFGPLALPAMLILAALTEAQLLLADYMRHYGLLRRRSRSGTSEPLSAAHAWAAPSALGDLLPRLAGVAPVRPGSDGAPVLPRSRPGMALRALVPPLWHDDLDARVMAMAKRNLSGDKAEAR